MEEEGLLRESVEGRWMVCLMEGDMGGEGARCSMMGGSSPYALPGEGGLRSEIYFYAIFVFGDKIADFSQAIIYF